MRGEGACGAQESPHASVCGLPEAEHSNRRQWALQRVLYAEVAYWLHRPKASHGEGCEARRLCPRVGGRPPSSGYTRVGRRAPHGAVRYMSRRGPSVRLVWPWSLVEHSAAARWRGSCRPHQREQGRQHSIEPCGGLHSLQSCARCDVAIPPNAHIVGSGSHAGNGQARVGAGAGSFHTSSSAGDRARPSRIVPCFQMVMGAPWLQLEIRR